MLSELAVSEKPCFNNYQRVWLVFFILASFSLCVSAMSLAQERPTEIQLETDKNLTFKVPLDHTPQGAVGLAWFYPPKPSKTKINLRFYHNTKYVKIKVSDGEKYASWPPDKVAIFKNRLDVRFSMDSAAGAEFQHDKIGFDFFQDKGHATKSSIKFVFPKDIQIAETETTIHADSIITQPGRDLQLYQLHFSTKPKETLQFEIEQGKISQWHTLHLEVEGFDKGALPREAIVEARITCTPPSSPVLFKEEDHPAKSETTILFSREKPEVLLEVAIDKSALEAGRASINIDFTLSGSSQNSLEPTYHELAVAWTLADDNLVLLLLLCAVVALVVVLFVAGRWKEIKGHFTASPKKPKDEYSTTESAGQAYGDESYEQADKSGKRTGDRSGLDETEAQQEARTRREDYQAEKNRINTGKVGRTGIAALGQEPRKNFKSQEVLGEIGNKDINVTVEPAKFTLRRGYQRMTLLVKGSSRATLQFEIVGGDEKLQIKDKSLNTTLKRSQLYELRTNALGDIHHEYALTFDNFQRATDLEFRFYESGSHPRTSRHKVSFLPLEPLHRKTTRDDDRAGTVSYSEQEYEQLRNENRTLRRDFEQRSKYYEDTIKSLISQLEQERKEFREAYEGSLSVNANLQRELEKLHKLSRQTTDSEQQKKVYDGDRLFKETLVHEETLQSQIQVHQNEASVHEKQPEIQPESILIAKAPEPESAHVIADEPSEIDLRMSKVIRALETVQRSSQFQDPRIAEAIVHALDAYKALHLPAKNMPAGPADDKSLGLELRRMRSNWQPKAGAPAAPSLSLKEREQIFDNLVQKEVLAIIHVLDTPKNPELAPALKALVEACGLQVLPASKHRKFDGEFHQSMGLVEGPQDLIVEVCKRGFAYKGKLLNRAEVTIGRG